MRFIDFAIVHHANQYMITNGYENREGLDDLIGIRGGRTGYLRIFELHTKYKIPINLHLSGTLLETILWHRPDFLLHLRNLRQQGLLDIIGSSYGQNIMRFFSRHHNFRQLNEEIRLYNEHLGVEPQGLKVFWPPERVWDTKRLAPSVADKRLLNRGYEYVLVDDRLLYPRKQGRVPRKVFDQGKERSVTDFYPCRISHGYGLTALPISFFLRQSIPPRKKGDLEGLGELFHWLALENSQAECGLIAVYGDDLEKSAGCCGWDEGGGVQYETFLKWLVRNPWVRPVKLNEWTAQCDACQKPIEVGSYFEMSHYFGAGEGYEKWYYDPKWEKYRRYYAWSERKVKNLNAKGADPALLEASWKHLLASSWETAWHIPTYGVHGEVSSARGPSPWAKAIASHSRHAAVIGDAAYWMKHKDRKAHAYLDDIDHDGHKELILKNHMLFAVFSPLYGGRLVYLFRISGREGKMVIGNPCDDWNWMEELNRYMETPPNHPGALAEVGHENDRYQVVIAESPGKETRAVMVNKQEGSQAFGLEKSFRLLWDKNEIEATYQLPQDLPYLSIECGLSPDYLNLLRFGGSSVKAFGNFDIRGYSNNGVSVWVRLADSTKAIFSEATPRKFGHGYAIQIRARSTPFTVWIGTRQTIHQ
jgi:Glycosyl hydrolase family 57